MADNCLNNENLAPSTPQDEEAAWILLSFKNNVADSSQACINTSIKMSPDKDTTQQAPEGRAPEHAMAQEALIPTAASICRTPSRLLISSHRRAVQKPKTSIKSFTRRLTFDVATTPGEPRIEIGERHVISPDRTNVAGRTDSNLEQKGMKVAVNHSRHAINASGGGRQDAMDIHSGPHGNEATFNRIRAGSLLLKKSNDNSLNAQQRNDASATAAAPWPLSLGTGGFTGGSVETSGHKPSINPFNGAQTTTAQHFLQTTANPATAGDDSRHAHLNNANELAKSLAVAPTVDHSDLTVIGGNDYAIIEGKRPGVARPCHQYDAVAAATSAPRCSTFRPVYIHTAKCDECNTRNRSVLYRCNTCSTQLDRACMTNNHEHGEHISSLDWTDHGAQSASKPRGIAGPRVKKTPAKNVAAKKRVPTRDEVAFKEQLASNDDKDKKKKKKENNKNMCEENSLSKSTDGAFEGGDNFMMLSPRVRIKREDKKVRTPPSEREAIRRAAGVGKRKAEEADIYEMFGDDGPKASKASRRPFVASGSGGVQSQERPPAWSKSAQSGCPAVPNQKPAHSAGSGGISSFFVEADRLREKYTRVTEEIESMRARLAKMQAEKGDIEAKIMKHIGN